MILKPNILMRDIEYKPSGNFSSSSHAYGKYILFAPPLQISYIT